MGFKYLIVLFPLLTGCSATMETTLNKSTPNAPTNEINGGVVSYLNDGYLSIKQKRREDAYRQMHEQCNGPYQILEEAERSENGSATPIGGMMFYGEEHHRYIRFACVHQ